jgi:hypothetical protein
MFNNAKAVRKRLLRDASRLERFCHSLWSLEGRLSVAAGFGENKEAEGMAATLGQLLVDHLQPALALLKREAERQPAKESAAEEQPAAEEATAQC